jgi:hypothetical protein
VNDKSLFSDSPIVARYPLILQKGEKMLSTLLNHFYACTRGWLILVIFVAFVVFLAVTLPSVRAASGDTEGLDTIFF